MPAATSASMPTTSPATSSARTRYAGAVSYTSQTLAQLVSAASVPGKDQVSTRQYDALNRLSSQIDAQGTSTTYSYDTRGFLHRRKRRRRRRHRHQPERRPGACPTKRTTSYFYDDLGRLTGTLLGIRSTGLRRRHPRQPARRPQRRRTTSTYDAAGTPDQTASARSTAAAWPPPPGTTTTPTAAWSTPSTRPEKSAAASTTPSGDVIKNTQYASRISTSGLIGGLVSTDSAFNTSRRQQQRLPDQYPQPQHQLHLRRQPRPADPDQQRPGLHQQRQLQRLRRPEQPDLRRRRQPRRRQPYRHLRLRRPRRPHPARRRQRRRGPDNTNTTYDAFGRITQVQDPTATSARPSTTNWAASSPAPTPWAKTPSPATTPSAAS